MKKDYLALTDEALDLVEKLDGTLLELVNYDPDEWMQSQAQVDFNRKTRDCLKVVTTRLHTAANTYRRYEEKAS